MYNLISSPDALAHIRGGAEAPQLRGIARFYQKPGYVLVEIHISGLPTSSPTGFYGLHIHEGGSCAGTGFPETKSHYNPSGSPHPAHAGDLPPLLLCNGGADMIVRTDRFRVSEIIGKTVVIHSDPDDFHTQPAGNAGNKIACGIIVKR